MSITKIDWCINPDGTQGDTWNMVQGCRTNPPCPYCYAKRIADRFGWDFYKPKINIKTWNDGKDKYVHCKKAKTIFVGSMSDIFGNWSWWDEEEKADIPYPKTPQNIIQMCIDINEIRKDQGKEQHVFLFLTKNPKGYLDTIKQQDLSQFYFGVTLEHFQDPKAHDMLEVIGKFGIKGFVSFEPILEYNEISQDTKDLVRNCSFYIMGYETLNGKVIPPLDETRLFWDTMERGLIPLNKMIFLKDSILPSRGSIGWQELTKVGRNLPWLK